MARAGIGVGALIMAGLVAPARAEQVLTVAGYTLRYPDAWIASEIAFESEGVIFELPGEVRLISLELRRGLTCDEQMTWSRTYRERPLSAVERSHEHWVGLRFSDDAGVNRGDYCRELAIGGEPAVVRITAREDVVDQALAIADAAIAAGPAPTVVTDEAVRPGTSSQPTPAPAPPPNLLRRLLPSRYEVGFARLTDGPSDVLDTDRAWGPTFLVERMLYDGGAPALGYKARLTPTGAGTAGYAEAAVGLSKLGISIQGVAGLGAAGEHAPLGWHAGIHGGLLLPNGLEAEGGYAWTASGTYARFEGRFVAKLFGRRAFSVGIGYDRREGAQVLTIDVGTLVMPPY